ncbi:hypothetical protein AYJ54_24090 [Bradyrhizobium centrolobii]|uniref:Uncharacterized protein n=1 Tax=Bradyrhizobium centrolobii TaxID=1505087 RepID=A0A176YDJ4_9BRAD|nr:hypothetical protein AYJ54_24090 [Bradyrhizobium centrolobii]
MLGWLVEERTIEPHIRVFDKSARTDGAFSRGDFAYDQQSDVYICPAGKVLASTGALVNDGATLAYRASKYDCDACELKPRCCPKTPSRKVTRSIHEHEEEWQHRNSSVVWLRPAAFQILGRGWRLELQDVDIERT